MFNSLLFTNQSFQISASHPTKDSMLSCGVMLTLLIGFLESQRGKHMFNFIDKTLLRKTKLAIITFITPKLSLTDREGKTTEESYPVITTLVRK